MTTSNWLSMWIIRLYFNYSHVFLRISKHWRICQSFKYGWMKNFPADIRSISRIFVGREKWGWLIKAGILYQCIWQFISSLIHSVCTDKWLTTVQRVTVHLWIRNNSNCSWKWQFAIEYLVFIVNVILPKLLTDKSLAAVCFEADIQIIKYDGESS